MFFTDFVMTEFCSSNLNMIDYTFVVTFDKANPVRWMEGEYDFYIVLSSDIALIAQWGFVALPEGFSDGLRFWP